MIYAPSRVFFNIDVGGNETKGNLLSLEMVVTHDRPDERFTPASNVLKSTTSAV